MNKIRSLSKRTISRSQDPNLAIAIARAYFQKYPRRGIPATCLEARSSARSESPIAVDKSADISFASVMLISRRVLYLSDRKLDRKGNSPSAAVLVAIRGHGEAEHGPGFRAVHRVVFRLHVEAIDDAPGWRLDDHEADEEAPEKPCRPHLVYCRHTVALRSHSVTGCDESLSYMGTDRGTDRGCAHVTRGDDRPWILN